MGYAAFDTLEAATKLEKSGIEREQAITFVSVMRDANNDAKLATKQDLINLSNDFDKKIDGVRFEISEIKSELKEDIHALDRKIDSVKTELKEEITNVRTEITEVKTELKEDIANVRTELKEDIHALDNRIIEVKGDIKSLNLVGVLILAAILAQLIGSIFKLW